MRSVFGCAGARDCQESTLQREQQLCTKITVVISHSAKTQGPADSVLLWFCLFNNGKRIPRNSEGIELDLDRKPKNI